MKQIYSPLALLSYFLMAWCIILFCTSSVFASSKTYVQTGEAINISMKDLPSGTDVTWTISKDGSILETKTGKKLKYIFEEAGDYNIRAATESKEGDVQNTLVEVEVGSSLPNFSPLGAILKSVPAAEDGVITLSGDSQSVTFSFEDATGEIDTYSFEADIFSDSDGDGIIDNDIDNKNDISYTSGTFYKHTYINSGLPARAVFTVTNETGETQTSAVTILFDDGEIQQERENKSLAPVLQSLPDSDSSGSIVLAKSGGTVLLYAGESSGSIEQYRIDTDLSFDSDGDGNPKNDFDNANTDSALDGSVFPLDVDSFTDSFSISLTVEDKNGATKTIEKTITPGDTSFISPSGNKLLVPLLFGSRSRILEGESVTFKLFNVQEGSQVSWDFNGDSLPEIKEGTATEVEYRYMEEGVYTVRAEILEVGDTPIIQKKTITVFNKNEGQLKTNPPKAEFLPQIDNNTVSFLSSKSSADQNLINTDLSFSWDFGDGYKTEGPNPVHVYEKEGTYDVILTVEDAVEKTGVFVETIAITSIQDEFIPSQHGGISFPDTEETPEASPVPAEDLPTPSEEPVIQDSTDTSTFSGGGFSLSAFPWWILLPLFLFLLPLLYLLKRKIDSPEQSIQEIVQSIIHPKPPAGDDSEIDILETFEAEETEESETVSDPLINEEENEEVPDWMRTYDDEEVSTSEDTDTSPVETISDEIENEEKSLLLDESISSPEEDIISSETENEQSALSPLEEESGPVPDWMNPTTEVVDTSLTENKEQEKGDIEGVKEGENEESPFSFDHPEWLDEVKQGDEQNTESTELSQPSLDPLALESIAEGTNAIDDALGLENNEAGDLPDWMAGDTQALDTESSTNLAINENESLDSLSPSENIEDTEVANEPLLDNVPDVASLEETVGSDLPEAADVPLAPLEEPSGELPDWMKESSSQENLSLNDNSLIATEPQALIDNITPDNTSEESTLPDLSESVSDDARENVQSDGEESLIMEAENVERSEKIPTTPKIATSSVDTQDDIPLEISDDDFIEEEDIIAIDASLPEEERGDDIPDWLK